MRKSLLRYAVFFVAWLPFFALWVLFLISYAGDKLSWALLSGMVSIGGASILGIAVWHLCQFKPWPLRLSARFYAMHLGLAGGYACLWILLMYCVDSLHSGCPLVKVISSSRVLGWQLLMGAWLYGLIAGISYAVQTRERLYEKEALAARAEALATAAHLDALRARLNPHFLFNALHTLNALVKFRPAIAESAIERLGDMLRYALREDGRGLVEFSEEYEFTRQYIAFEQLRFEERLRVDFQIDPESFHCNILPFSIQLLAENAVRHAISIRPEGGRICIGSSIRDDALCVSVKDDGPGSAGPDSSDSHRLGLRSLRERLRAAYGDAAQISVEHDSQGSEARFVVPLLMDPSK